MEHFLKFLQAWAVLNACLIAIYFQLRTIYGNLQEDPEECTFPDDEGGLIMNKISKFFCKKMLLLELKLTKQDLEVYEQEIERLKNEKNKKTINLKEFLELNKELNILKKEQQKDLQYLTDVEKELKELNQ